MNVDLKTKTNTELVDDLIELAVYRGQGEAIRKRIESDVENAPEAERPLMEQISSVVLGLTDARLADTQEVIDAVKAEILSRVPVAA